MTQTPPILIETVTVDYGSRPVLDGLSLSVPAGSITALLGGNGAGKSTTLSTLLGFVRPKAGVVRVDGVDPSTDPDGARRHIAYPRLSRAFARLLLRLPVQSPAVRAFRF